MKKLSIVLVGLLFLLPSVSFAQTVDYSPQYISLLQQLLAALEQELQIVLANQSTLTNIQSSTAQIAQNTQTKDTGTVAPVAPTQQSFEIYQLVSEAPSIKDIYYWGSENIDPSSIQIGSFSFTDRHSADGTIPVSFINGTLPITFTISSQMDEGNDCIYVNGQGEQGAYIQIPQDVTQLLSGNRVKRCGGKMMRLTPSEDLASGRYQVVVTGIDGQTAHGLITVP